MTTLSARAMVKAAYPNGCTWSDDKTVQIGKLSPLMAYEINYQPSHEEFGTPFSLTFITHNPDNGNIAGQHQCNFATLHEALIQVSAIKYAESTKVRLSDHYSKLSNCHNLEYAEKYLERSLKAARSFYDKHEFALHYLDDLYARQLLEIIEHFENTHS